MNKKQPILSKPVLIFVIIGLILAVGLSIYTVYSKNSREITPVVSLTPTPRVSQSSSTTASPLVTPSQSQSSIKSISVSELWAKKNDYLNKDVVVEDIVTFLSSCPDFEGVKSNQCSTAVYIGLQGANNFQLYQNGKTIECSGTATTCQNFEKDKTYKITGRLLKTELGTFYLDILSSQRI